MAEKIITGYQRLFEVRLLHHYWLDDGKSVFDALPQNAQNALLLQYDCRRFMSIEPTTTSKALLKGLGCIFKSTALGFIVAVKAGRTLPIDAKFSFLITITDTSFYSYTALTLLPFPIYEEYSALEDRILRFKENVPVFSNLTGSVRGSGLAKKLFLSKEIPPADPAGKVEFLSVSSGVVSQLNSDNPGGTSQVIGPATDLPVFVNQADINSIIVPAGLTGVPARGIQLKNDIPDTVFGIIEISAVHPTDTSFSFIAAGLAKTPHPVYEIRFRNRMAYRRYLNKTNGTLNSETSDPLPLSFRGNAGTKSKPDNALIKVSYEDDDPAKRIEKVFTEIFE